MAGAYPDPPSHRIPWERDGTLVNVAGGSVSEFSQSVQDQLNSERRVGVDGGTGDIGGRVCILLPTPMTLEAWWANGTNNDWDGTDQLEVSTDTTNGLDGTWTSVGGDSFSSLQVEDAYRENWIALNSVTGIVGARFVTKGTTSQDRQVGNFHLYGTYETDNPALMIWDPDNDQRLGPVHFDWGDVQRGTTATKRFRVKNTSASEDAIGVTLSDESLYDGSPSNTSQHDFSDDGGANFSDPLDIGDLTTGEISGELLLRRDMADDAPLGVWALRILAQATSWSEVS